MKNKKIAQRIIALILISAFIFGFYLILERDKINRIESSILSFQSEYKQFIDEDDIVDLGDLTRFEVFGSHRLTNFYNNVKDETLRSFEKEYLAQLYIFNFLKNENTSNFSQENELLYKELVDDNIDLSLILEQQQDVDTLILFKDNNIKIREIVVAELDKDKDVIKEYIRAKRNNGTTTKINNNCFTNQSNETWQLDKTMSNNFATKLGVSVFNVPANLNNSESFIGITLNNPRRISSKRKYIDYVSYKSNDFRVEHLVALENLKKDYKLYAEVYVTSVLGRNIYKYNVVAIANDYKLSCDAPK